MLLPQSFLEMPRVYFGKLFGGFWRFLNFLRDFWRLLGKNPIKIVKSSNKTLRIFVRSRVMKIPEVLWTCFAILFMK